MGNGCDQETGGGDNVISILGFMIQASEPGCIHYVVGDPHRFQVFSISFLLARTGICFKFKIAEIESDLHQKAFCSLGNFVQQVTIRTDFFS
jgi:hypothetical protein